MWQCLPDGCDRTPEEIVEFDVPANHVGVELGYSKASKEGGRVQQRRVAGQQLLCNLVEVAIDSRCACRTESLMTSSKGHSKLTALMQLREAQVAKSGGVMRKVKSIIVLLRGLLLPKLCQMQVRVHMLTRACA